MDDDNDENGGGSVIVFNGHFSIVIIWNGLKKRKDRLFSLICFMSRILLNNMNSYV